MKNYCLFCGSDEWTPPEENEFICSICICILSEFSQVDLELGRQKAAKKGFDNKVKALESFLKKGSNNVRKEEKKFNRRAKEVDPEKDLGGRAMRRIVDSGKFKIKRITRR